MKKYTHFTENEITGEYYNEKTDWFLETLVLIKYFTGFVIMIVFMIIIADLIFGAETVTNFIADLLGMFINR